MYILNTTTWIETSLQTNVYSKHYNLNRNITSNKMYILNTTTWIETSIHFVWSDVSIQVVVFRIYICLKWCFYSSCSVQYIHFVWSDVSIEVLVFICFVWSDVSIQVVVFINFKQNVYSKHYNLNKNITSNKMYILCTTTWIETSLQTKCIFWTLQLE